VYDLYTLCIDRKEGLPNNKIERLRKELLDNKTTISTTDFGAGSNRIKNSEKTISDIAKQASSPPYMGKLLYRLVKYIKPNSIIELGASLGIGTSYLASGNSESSVISIEGDPELANIAQNNLNKLGLTNVTVIKGDFDTTLAEILSKIERIGIAFVDGNHTEEATLKYFNLLSNKVDNDSLIIFDDIRWSDGMQKAWERICCDAKVSISIDLFNCGLVFFRKGVVKQHFALRYGPF